MKLNLKAVTILTVSLAAMSGIAFADAMSDAASRLKIGQDALAANDPVKAGKYCEAAVLGLPAETTADVDMMTADGTECQAKALIMQGKNQEGCDLIYPVIDMMKVSKATNKADAVARLKAVLDPEVAAKRCE